MQNFIFIIALSLTLSIYTTNQTNAHTKWDYHSSNWQCKDYKGKTVDNSHCRPMKHTPKVCRSKDNHDHGNDYSVGDQNFETESDAKAYARENGGRVRERGDDVCDGSRGRNCN